MNQLASEALSEFPGGWAWVGVWWKAARAPFLMVSLTPSLLGGAIAYQQGAFDGGLLVWILLGVLAAHASANLLDDYWDYFSGALANKDQQFHESPLIRGLVTPPPGSDRRRSVPNAGRGGGADIDRPGGSARPVDESGRWPDPVFLYHPTHQSQLSRPGRAFPVFVFWAPFGAGNLFCPDGPTGLGTRGRRPATGLVDHECWQYQRRLRLSQRSRHAQTVVCRQMGPASGGQAHRTVRDVGFFEYPVGRHGWFAPVLEPLGAADLAIGGPGGASGQTLCGSDGLSAGHGLGGGHHTGTGWLLSLGYWLAR
ncbi:hypothetical protein CCP4SC76_7720002 [Gammaproteobacteria bacterium]